MDEQVLIQGLHGVPTHVHVSLLECLDLAQVVYKKYNYVFLGINGNINF